MEGSKRTGQNGDSLFVTEKERNESEVEAEKRIMGDMVRAQIWPGSYIEEEKDDEE